MPIQTWTSRLRILSGKKALLLLVFSVWFLASCTHSSKRLKDSDRNPFFPVANFFRKVERDLPVLRVDPPTIPGAEYVNDDQLCMTCHQTYVESFAHNVHRGQSCEDCHGPASRHLITRGQEPGLILNFNKLKKAERSEICLRCHEQQQCEPDIEWRTSVHAHEGVACTDCHTAHYNLTAGTHPNDPLELPQETEVIPSSYLQEQLFPLDDWESVRAQSNNLGAVAPQVCYRCHDNMRQFEEVAHPHQTLGPEGFSCSTCHNPHGNIRQESRTELCLSCHQGTPTMAWHASTHSMHGVACTDCHNPHPSTFVQSPVGIDHTSVSRASRMPMSVDEPNTCYKCHPKIYAESSLPSHHPIKEGKVVCSDCHDGHGQFQGNLTEATVNQLCYKCHAEKQGPFAYEHPPVTENCMACHTAHGAVADNLLQQPTTFLCLRCHSGHRVGPTSGAHTFGGLIDVGNDVNQQRAFFSDCTECHAQVHGSDLPSPRSPHGLLR